MSKATLPQLVATLSHPNGWWRDTAQRLLVERADPKSVPLLEKVALGKDAGATLLGRIHAIWALQGMEKLEDGVLQTLALWIENTQTGTVLEMGQLEDRRLYFNRRTPLGDLRSIR